MPQSIISTTLATLTLVTATSLAQEKISFNEHIRPILNSKCTKCHGGAKADGDLSLIYREEALGKGKSGKTIIVPGKPEESELFRRIITDDLDDKMPLQKGDHAEPPLPPEEVALIKKWIEQGAEWEEHWAYVKPKKEKLPNLKHADWSKTGMDQYVLAKLEAEGLAPSPEADKAQWLRRASLDIIGLPPTPEELEAFVADQSVEAYEKQVDRLLASPHFGERWASIWMDLARYADTMGYEKDPHRNIWPYRDYLIRSFNNDKPYNIFVQEQLAGDLMPSPTSDQLLATAFHRNTQTNTEGGTDDEEFRVASTIDRVNTTWTALQGLTFGCIQCHAHPYEPIPHGDYYRFYAFFNSTEDADLNNDYPHFKIANDLKQRDETASLYTQLTPLREKINQPGQKAIAQDKGWQPLNYLDVKTSSGKLSPYPNGELRTSGTLAIHTDFTLKAEAQNFSALKVTIIPETENPAELPERGSVLSHIKIQKLKVDGKAEDIKLAYAFADTITGPYDPLDSLRGGASGFGGYPKLFTERSVVFVPSSPVSFEPGERLNVIIQNKASTTGNQAATLRRFQVHTSTSPVWTELISTEEHKQSTAKLTQLEKQYNSIKGTNVPVIQQRPESAKRETRLFIGGLWLNKGDLYTEGVPELLNRYKAPASNRLEMAKWITSEENPLTSRVMANRIFSEFFGRGIVSTLGDFGSTGVVPTNLPLLDYLAVEFQGTHQWSIKSLIREMALSATYRQDNKASKELAKDDPSNLLLARGPRTRLNAEMIRDNALSISGLLTPTQLGPSVMPPQPNGIWQTVYSGSKWNTAEGPNRYRRGVYTYWKRTSPYPSMITFDAPARDLCSAQRIPTNTPLHALITLNDPVYLECSKALAKRMVNEGGASLETQIRHGYKLATCQEASSRTVELLTQLHDQMLADFQANTENSKKIASSPEEAAKTVLANTIMNLDSALTK
ncbi:Planctomycete cytochrome C [Rubritalea squalenifaciens DSM 18772]|uniref:Planctomycete cytochrome C n=1 Tax=Rubritalea squalenifaciens DSM 18772 TaxID=1123071 RepID=A0A1M6HJP1_9BACT|nr:PSD1 and planctomycete cytochrome C domain-containing protein [Rubritalea squalenifaciens]SHJ22423.1 Planctomycete cytochrome C [Rubritalea squalenifaciens DSM 18772]